MMSRPLFPDLIVNGEQVPHAVVAAETQNHEAPRDKPGIAWRKAVNAVAIRTLLLQEGRRRGLSPASEEVAPGRFETDEEALIRALLEQAVDVTPPTDDAIRDEWARNPARFRTRPLWEVSHILCACDPDDIVARAKAHDRAKGILALVQGDPASFVSLAARESDCGSRSSGGALGQLGPGDTVPEFEAALRMLTEGAISSDPVRTRHGYHLIRMDALAEGQVLPFDAVRGRIADAMEKADWASRARAFVDGLVATADIRGADLKAA